MKTQLVLFFGTLLVLCGLSLAADKPNVVIIFVDDMGYADIGPFGAVKQKTPALDRMAADGMKLTSFYAAPVCSVSRAQLMTGCYGVRVSVPGVYHPASKQGLNPSETTIAEHLKNLGYATACVGKWHLGDQAAFLPTKQGFDSYFGLPYSNDMQRVSIKTKKPVVPLLRNEKVIELLTDDQQPLLTERYIEESLSFIRSHRDTPFFLYLAHTAIHTPVMPNPKFLGKSGNGRVGDWIEEVDAGTERILQLLQELKLAENTLVIFTSDNGPWLSKKNDSGSAGPLRGGKGATWEGGVRVPTLAWWPGKISPGTNTDVVMGTIDLLPTVVSLAGGKMPETPVIDGRDASAILFGKAKDSPSEAHYYYLQNELQAVRQGQWKLALKPQTLTMGSMPPEDAKGPEPRLYHLGNDLGESTNVASENPEVVARLQKLAGEMEQEISMTQRQAGRVEAAVMLYPAEMTSPAAPKMKKGAKRKS